MTLDVPLDPVRASRASDDLLEERLGLIDAAIYADVCDCAVTGEELWRYSRVPTSQSEFRRRLEQDAELVSVLRERDGLHCLAGRERLLDLRPPRRRRAARLQSRARVAARFLQHAPFVRGLLLTGSAAADDAPPEADVDLLVLVRRGRLAIAFALLGGLSRLVSRKLFCPNYYLSDAHLALGRRDRYVARELVQARPLARDGQALLAANDWARRFLPNASSPPPPVRALSGGGALQRLIELPLRGRLGDALERGLRRVALARLRDHHAQRGSVVPDEVVADLEAGIQLRFHGVEANESLLARYEQRRREIAALL